MRCRWAGQDRSDKSRSEQGTATIRTAGKDRITPIRYSISCPFHGFLREQPILNLGKFHTPRALLVVVRHVIDPCAHPNVT
jgi:hypothetical protein